jgi:hypothetical protein
MENFSEGQYPATIRDEDKRPKLFDEHGEPLRVVWSNGCHQGRYRYYISGKRLPFREGSFDLVVCLYGLHHFQVEKRVTRISFRVSANSDTHNQISDIESGGIAATAINKNIGPVVFEPWFTSFLSRAVVWTAFFLISPR